MNILLTGATGYVGRCLLPKLEQQGYRVRCLARRPEKITENKEPSTTIMVGDAANADDLARACHGIDVAFWLVHSMESGVDFERADRLAAEQFGKAAKAAGVDRIIYLGGLGADNDTLSAHLRSRHEVGAILRASGVEVIEFRASIIIGAGSFSFDLVRTLVERLPVMICPSWVATPTQPIAIADIVSYLTAAICLEKNTSQVFEIGGPDKESYGAIMKEYARQRGLTRLMIPVPVLTPRLSSLWLKLVATKYSKVGRKLIDGLKNPTVVEDTRSLDTFRIRPRDLRTAVREAEQNEDQEFANKRWADVADSEELPHRYGGKPEGSRLVDHRHAVVSVSPEKAFTAIECIGGQNGWYACNWLWKLRGLIDRCCGGPGMSRGRRDPKTLVTGDTLDCWHVEFCDPPRRLRLAAEMKIPGRGWLEFEVVPRADDVTIHQTAVFDPKGLSGLVYWYAIWPLHELVFTKMLAGIVKKAAES
ncbi:MAG: SDR family oxidoreductase [Pirellulales bacterium]